MPTGHNFINYLITLSTPFPLKLEIFAIPAFLGVTMATLGFCNSAPPTPPSVSAASRSEPFFLGLKTVS